MELFIWLWAYDRKLICGLRHSYFSFVYIWLVPVIMAATALVFSYLAQTFDNRDMRKCFEDDAVAEQGRILQKLVLIQEGLLVCIAFAAVCTMIQADGLFRSKPIKALPLHTNFNPQTQQERDTVSYEFWLRSKSLKTCSATILLTLGLCNYFFSFIFALGFQRYHSSLDTLPLEGNCEIAGALTLLCYSVFLVMLSGSWCLLVYSISAFLKILHLALIQIFPVSLTRAKRNLQGIPTKDYTHYLNDFSFEVDSSSEPVCHQR